MINKEEMRIPIILYILLAPLYLVTLILGAIHSVITFGFYPIWFVNLMFYKRKLFTFHEYMDWIPER